MATPIADARADVLSVSEELRLLLRKARKSDDDTRAKERMADRVAELVDGLKYAADELAYLRKASNMEPCARCGSPFLDCTNYPRCPDCGTVHGECPHCGELVLDDEVHCDPEEVGL